MKAANSAMVVVGSIVDPKLKVFTIDGKIPFRCPVGGPSDDHPKIVSIAILIFCERQHFINTYLFMHDLKMSEGQPLYSLVQI